MTLADFSRRVIDDAMEAAESAHQRSPARLAGAGAGLAACRDMNPRRLRALLSDAQRQAREAVAECNDIRRARSDSEHARDRAASLFCRQFCAEVEWVCLVVSAGLTLQNARPIVPPTLKAMERASALLRRPSGSSPASL